MEVFSVFATLSLVDLLSSPLDRIRSGMASLQGQTGSVGQAFGNLTMAMAPVALAAGVVVGALGLCTSKAIAFESAMADVAKVVNFDGPAEFQAMSQQVKELAGRIPMAADGIAAIIASAGQSGVAKQDLTEFAEQAAKMGVAFDLTGAVAGKMMADWRAGMGLTLPQTYALADAVNHLSNNMNATAPALGEVVQRVGAAAMSCGLAETEVAALGAAFLSAGATPEVAATALKKFTTTLVKGTAMSKEQAAAFQGLGFSATQMAKDMQTDAQGTIFKVLQAIADKPKELQMSLLTEMFGEEAIGAIAPLLKNMGLLDQSFKLVGDSANYAGSMQAEFDARSKTAQNALVLLSNKLTNLAISVGSVFLPFVSKAAAVLGVLVDAIRVVVDSPFGQWLVGAVGAVSSAVLAVTAFSAGLWALSGVGAMVGKALLPLKVIILGISWPIWLLVGAAAGLYLAFRSNFGGIADILAGWWRTITLVIRGVLAVFQSLKGGVGEIRGELATTIKAEGLVGLVTTVSRVVYRIREFFLGIWDGLNFDRLTVSFIPAIVTVLDAMNNLSAAFMQFFGGQVSSASSTWRAFGQTIGSALQVGAEIAAQALGTLISWGLKAVTFLGGVWTTLSAVFGPMGAILVSTVGRLAEAFGRVWTAVAGLFSGLTGNEVKDMTVDWEYFGNVLGNILAAGLFVATKALEALTFPLSQVMNLFSMLIALCTGDIPAATESLRAIFVGMGEFVAVIGDVFGVGNAIRAVWAEVIAYLDGLNLFESGAKLLGTFVDGIKSMAGKLYDSMASALQSVRNLLPFSDAKEGPLSTLTLSGTRMMSTLAQGVSAGAAGLLSSVTGALAGVGNALGGWWDKLTGGAVPALPGVVPPNVAPSGVTMPSVAMPSADMPPVPGPKISDPAMQNDSGRREAVESQATTGSAGGTGGVTIHIANLNLPNVTNRQEFVSGLQGLVAEYEGA